MENVTEALKMAAWVLVFVLALFVSISAFGQARVASDAIISYRDRENDYIYVENNNKANREVGIETIIPSMYRIYKENYKIKFNFTIYKKDGENISEIDLEKETLSEEQKELFVKCILYGNKEKEGNFKNIEFDDGIYEELKKYTFIEELGEYYQGEDSENDSVSENNKTKKRVITYTKKES